jgi:hypothetical protein
LAQIIDIKSPKMRLIEYSPSEELKNKRGDEYTNLKKTIYTLKKGRQVSRKIEKELDHKFLMVMEYLPNSYDLGEIDNEELKKSNTFYYYDIGAIAIFDLIINNWDR